MIFIGLALSGAGVMLVPFSTGVALVVMSVVGGIEVGTVWTNTDAIVSNLAKQGRVAAILGAAGSFKELGDMLGPLLVGSLSQAAGLQVGFVACGALGFAALISFAFIGKRGSSRTP